MSSATAEAASHFARGHTRDTQRSRVVIDSFDFDQIHNLIVHKGIHPDSIYFRNRTFPLLKEAQAEGQWDTVFLLLKHKVTCKSSLSLLQGAADADAWEVVEYLINHYENIDVNQCQNVLEKAWDVGQWGVVEALFQKDIKVDAPNSLEVGQLHILAAMGSAELANEFSSVPRQIKDYIPKDIHGRIPLHVAAALGNEHWMRLYLEPAYESEQPPTKGGEAPPSKPLDLRIFDVQDSSGSTPFKLFLERGIRINKQARPNRSSFEEYLELAKRVVPLFLESGADRSFGKDSRVDKMFRRIQKNSAVNAPSRAQKKTPLIIACENDSQADVDQCIDLGAKVNFGRGEGGKKALHIACGKGNEGIVRSLLASWADVNAKDDAGRFPLHYACQQGHVGIANLLLDKNASPNSMDRDKCTPFNYACKTENTDLVHALLAEEAIVSPEMENVETPLHSACQAGSVEVIEILLERGAKPEAKWKRKFPSDLIPEGIKEEIIGKFPRLLEHEATEGAATSSSG
ncbi:MAG: Phosphocholine transferase AnkX [Chlamydiae bacterium]|nr:Phosphocholine transferase AnkX [Chlamydiota bacterium]